MLQQQVYIINNILMVLDALSIIAAAYGAFFIKYFESGGIWSIDDNIFGVSVLLVIFLNNYLMGRFQLYSDRKPASYLNLSWAVFKAILVDFLCLSAGVFFLQKNDYSRLFLLSFGLLSFILVLVQRVISQLIINRFSGKNFNARKILVVGNKERGELISSIMEKQQSWGHEVIGRLGAGKEEDRPGESLGRIEDLHEILRDHAVDEVVFALDGDRSVDLSGYIETCKKMGISARILPALWRPEEKGLSTEKCQNIPFLTIRTDNFDATGMLYKRVLDLLGGLFGSILFFIMYPVVAAAIKLDSRGPVIFKQKRIGQHGRLFRLYKFRSMYEDAEQRKQDLMEKNEMNGFLFKLKDDPRITRVGKWLRKTSLDEFPQFLNVLKGEMSLVGTRPPTPDEVEKYQPQHLRRISAKPGITGLWQVSGRNEITDFEKVVELDLTYLDNWRFADDLKILIKTILVVLVRKGAV